MALAGHHTLLRKINFSPLENPVILPNFSHECKCCFGIAVIKNRPVVFTSTFLGKNPPTRQTRRTLNRSRANWNWPIRNTFIVFCWNQSQTILLQGSQELFFSLLYMRRRALGRDCVLNYFNKGEIWSYFLAPLISWYNWPLDNNKPES